MSTPKAYVRTDSSGAMRVGDTRVSLDSIVAAFESGHSPETIHEQFPALTLEAVYGAIAYYLANTAEVGAYLDRQEELWSKWRATTAAKVPAVVQRLRARRSPARR